MKPSQTLIKLGKWLMQHGRLRIVIADDEAAYFNENMLKAAKSAGYHGIERIHYVTQAIFSSWLTTPPNIVILDVRNVCDSGVAKDGIELARTLLRETSAMVAVTSAHKWHFRKSLPQIDYFIEDRQLTSTDFVNELSAIVDYYLSKKARFYRHVLMRIGVSLVRGAMQGVG
ncbi:MAG TPA: hypothetical protein VM532_03255 [Burkholderiales bacterium]|jgi:hypothetical protein|nr:hypothetical protein [Burkholderiales bacterium]